MTYRLVRTSYFDRRLARFARRHPDVAHHLSRVLHDLAEDPRRARLRLHALHGELEGLHAIWVTYEYRLVLELHEADGEVLLVSIGSHQEVYE